MRAIVVGTGTIGTAVKKVLQEHGHDVATVGRGSGDFKADISDIESLKSLFATIGPFDAVANAAGDVFPGPLELTTDEQWTKSLRSKGMGQINLVRSALPYIADKGSFTLVSGVLTDEYMHGGTIGTTINHLVEGFRQGVCRRTAARHTDQLHQSHGPCGVQGLPRVLHGLHPGTRC